MVHAKVQNKKKITNNQVDRLEKNLVGHDYLRRYHQENSSLQ